MVVRKSDFRRAASGHAPTPGWRSIETAPEGEPFLLQYRACKRNLVRQAWITGRGYQTNDCVIPFKSADLLGWQPLPPAEEWADPTLKP
jgi:hypothetical protein